MPENPFDAESDEQQDQPRKGDQSKAFERIQTERDEARKQIEGLAAQLAERDRRDAFVELGIDKKYAKLYQGEATADSIKAWATEFGFVGAAPAPAEVTEAGAPEAPTEQAPPAPVTAGQPPVIGGKPTYEGKISVRDYQKLILDGRTDEAAKAYNEGRVEILQGGKFTGATEE